MGQFRSTRYSEHIISKYITMNTKLILTTALVAISCIAFANAGQMFILDDGDFEEHVRVKRSPQAQRRDGPVFVPTPIADEKSDPYSPPIPYKAPKSYKKGRVGPVYTFVKTDPYANFKWGVRHVVGHKYGR